MDDMYYDQNLRFLTTSLRKITSTLVHKELFHTLVEDIARCASHGKIYHVEGTLLRDGKLASITVQTITTNTITLGRIHSLPNLETIYEVYTKSLGRVKSVELVREAETTILKINKIDDITLEFKYYTNGVKGLGDQNNSFMVTTGDLPTLAGVVIQHGLTG